MINVDGGVEVVGRIQDYLNIAIDGVEDVLGIKDMSILSLEKKPLVQQIGPILKIL